MNATSSAAPRASANGGGGRKGALFSRADQLVFILVYFRLYPVQVVQGWLFGMGQPQANEWIQRLTPLLHEALGYQQQLPARQTKAITEVLAACPGLEFILDGTERPLRRPSRVSANATTTAARRNGIQ